MLVAVLLIAVSVILFCIKGRDERNIGWNDDDSKYFYWAFWLGVGGALLTLLSAFFYVGDGCRARSHEGYTRGEVV